MDDRGTRPKGKVKNELSSNSPPPKKKKVIGEDLVAVIIEE